MKKGAKIGIAVTAIIVVAGGVALYAALRNRRRDHFRDRI